MRELRFDVVIAGAGPAGSTLALRLARSGFAVALVEARRFPRFKACGEFMSPECLRILGDLALAGDVEALGARSIRGMRVHGFAREARGGFGPVGRVSAPFDHGWAVRRERFDQVLLEGALRTGGVTLFEDARAVGLVRSPEGAVLGLRVRARGGPTIALRGAFTVGADGVRSCVARTLGVVRPRDELDKLALTSRWRGVEWSDWAEVHLFEGGYFACAPVDGGLVTLNLVVERARFRESGLTAQSFLAGMLAMTPALGQRLTRGTRTDPVRGLGPLAGRTSEQVFDGAALVGDACGYVDPLTGEGVFFALRGAELLANDLESALHERRTDRDALRRYARSRADEVAPREALALLLQRGLSRPWIARRALAVLEGHPQLMELLVSLTGDYAPLRELARPVTWARVLRRPVRVKAG